jgi:hypothetical protein
MIHLQLDLSQMTLPMPHHCAKQMMNHHSINLHVIRILILMSFIQSFIYLFASWAIIEIIIITMPYKKVNVERMEEPLQEAKETTK